MYGTLRGAALVAALLLIPTLAHAGHSPIKHVVLIVRENRTFDQVFGDLRRKDADVRRDADRSGLAGWFGGWF